MGEFPTCFWVFVSLSCQYESQRIERVEYEDWPISLLGLLLFQCDWNTIQSTWELDFQSLTARKWDPRSTLLVNAILGRLIRIVSDKEE